MAAREVAFSPVIIGRACVIVRPRRRSVGERDKLGEARGAGRLARPLGEFLAAVSPGGVGGGGVAGEGFGAGAGVALEGAHGGVSGAGQQHRGVGAVLGVVGQRGVAQLVQRPAVCLGSR